MTKAQWKRENVWLRLALVAPTKAGKTTGALTIAQHLFEDDGGLPVTLIDTEYRRGALYADVFRVDHYRTIEGNFSPDTYIKEIDEAERENPGGILIIDSVTHEWNNSGGVLEIVDSGKGGNWKAGSPAHNRFTNRIASCQMHVIVCIRAKMKYEWQDADGKRMQPRKLGVGPEQRDNFLYDYDIEGDIDLATHLCTFTQRVEPGSESPLNGKVVPIIPDNDPFARNEVADTITKWLAVGEPPAPPARADDAEVAETKALLLEAGVEEEKIEERFAAARLANRGELAPKYIAKTRQWAEQQVAKKKADAAAASAPAESAVA